MFARKSVETNISVQLEELITTDSCLKVVMELLKYLLYEKEQIPFSYDSMQLLQRRNKPGDKNFNSFQKLFTTLETISNELNLQFFINGCDMKEVLIAFGATINTPKIVVRIELPATILSSRKHLEYQHNSRKPLLNLLRSMHSCKELQNALTTQLGLTNTFVMIQKSDPNTTSDFFLPKPGYNTSLNATKFCIKLTYDEQCLSRSCKCFNAVNIFNDATQSNVIELSSNDSEESNDSNIQTSYQWYQSKEVIKGFKYL